MPLFMRTEVGFPISDMDTSQIKLLPTVAQDRLLIRNRKWLGMMEITCTTYFKQVDDASIFG